MGEGKTVISEQMEKLQTLMHRLVFHNYVSEGKPTRNPYRGQGRVLAALNQNPQISQKELTQQLGMSKQSLAELLGKLEKSGMIRRTQSERTSAALLFIWNPKAVRLPVSWVISPVTWSIFSTA